MSRTICGPIRFETEWSNKRVLKQFRMNPIESLRVYILGNPVTVSENTSIWILIVHYLLLHPKFLVMVAVIVLLVALILIFTFTRRQKLSLDYMIYLVGAFLIFSAINFKYTSILSENDPKYLDNKIINALKNVVNYNYSNMVGGFTAFMCGVTRLLGVNSHSNLISINNLSQAKCSKNSTKFRNEGNEDDCGILKVDDKEKFKKSGPSSTNFSIFAVEPQNKDTTTLVIPENKVSFPVKIIPPKANNAVLTKDRANDESSSKEDSNDHAKENLKLKQNNPPIDEDNSNAKKIDPVNASMKNCYDKRRKELENSSEIDSDGSNDANPEDFMKCALHVINDEISMNKQLAKYIKDVLATRAVVEKDLKTFTSNFKKFFELSKMIEPEMASFNASPKYFKFEAKDMATNARNALEIGKVLENIDIDGGKDINNVLEQSNKKIKPNTAVVEENAEWSNLGVFKIFFTIQIFLGVVLLTVILCEIDLMAPLRYGISISLACGALLSIYIFLYSHIVNKTCIIGNIGGCKGNFTEGFAKFAEETDIDVDKIKKGDTDRVEEVLDNMQEKTKSSVFILKDYLTQDYFMKYRYQNLIFQNLFDKIYFVKDEFNKLTANKANKEDMYSYVDAMDHALYRIQNTLSNIKHDVIVDFYTREIIFLNFLKSHKKRIFLHSHSKLENDESTSSPFFDGGRCAQLKRKICGLNWKADMFFIVLLLGSLIFLVLFSL